MPKLNPQPFILANFNGHVGLQQSYEAYAQAVLSLLEETYSVVNGIYFCRHCKEFDVTRAEVTLGGLIEHAQSHQSSNEPHKGTFLKG